MPSGSQRFLFKGFIKMKQYFSVKNHKVSQGDYMKSTKVGMFSRKIVVVMIVENYSKGG